MKRLCLLLALAVSPAFAFQPVLGEVTPSVTPANVKTTICVPGYTATVRPSVSYTNTVKALLAGGDETAARACVGAAYLRLKDWRKAVQSCAQTLPVANDPALLAQYELDHKVPLAVGGHPESLHNLWLQPWPQARKKDVIESDIHDQVCKQSLPLRKAQRRFIEPM